MQIVNYMRRTVFSEITEIRRILNASAVADMVIAANDEALFAHLARKRLVSEDVLAHSVAYLQYGAGRFAFGDKHVARNATFRIVRQKCKLLKRVISVVLRIFTFSIPLPPKIEIYSYYIIYIANCQD